MVTQLGGNDTFSILRLCSECQHLISLFEDNDSV